MDILRREGFNIINSNANRLSIEINSSERINAINKLIGENIPIDDFFTEEPTLENIMNEV